MKRGTFITLGVAIIVIMVIAAIYVYQSRHPVLSPSIQGYVQEEDSQPEIKDTAPVAQEKKKEVTIYISRFDFDKPEITIQPGTTVIWENTDTRRHIITNPHGDLFRETRKSLETGDTFNYTFEREGVYEILEANFGIQGKVIVKNNAYDPLTGYAVANIEQRGYAMMDKSLLIFGMSLLVLVGGFFISRQQKF